MNVCFYIGLVSISLGAPAWGMGNLSMKEQFFLATAPIDTHSICHEHPHFPTLMARGMAPLSHSAPAATSFVPSPKTPTRSISALGKNKSPKNKSPRHASESSIDKESALLVQREKDRVQQIAALKTASEILKQSLDTYSAAIERALLTSLNQSEKPEHKS